jgi:DNA replicative helicase MCM subunit Mcm2 (Cdc46/Mcm family)
MNDTDLEKRAEEIYKLLDAKKVVEARKKFKKLVEETVAHCDRCKKIVPIELDKSTRNKPFYFCLLCGNEVKLMDIDEAHVIDLDMRTLQFKHQIHGTGDKN